MQDNDQLFLSNNGVLSNQKRFGTLLFFTILEQWNMNSLGTWRMLLRVCLAIFHGQQMKIDGEIRTQMKMGIFNSSARCGSTVMS